MPFGFESAISMIGFFELGILAREKQLFQRSMIKVRWSDGLLLNYIMCIILLSYYNGWTSVRTLIFGNFALLFVITSIIGILSITNIAKRFDNSKMLILLGQNTMPVLLMHKFPILFFQSILPVTKTFLKNGDSISGVVCGIIVSVISIVMCLIAGKLIEKICPVAIGK